MIDQIYEILVSQKIFVDGTWHAYDESGAELSDVGGILWRANPGALLMWPRAPEAFLSGGGGGAHGVDARKRRRTFNDDFESEDRLRAEIIREDEEILMVLMSALTTGAMKKWLH